MAPLVMTAEEAWPAKRPLTRSPTASNIASASKVVPPVPVSPSQHQQELQLRQLSSTPKPALNKKEDNSEMDRLITEGRAHVVPHTGTPLSPHRVARIAQSFGVAISLPPSVALPASTFSPSISQSSSFSPLINQGGQFSPASPSFGNNGNRSRSPSGFSHVPSRFLVSVLPPPELSGRTRRGSLLPLYPTLNGQLLAIAREYQLPSVGGLIVYFVTHQPTAPPSSSSGRSHTHSPSPTPSPSLPSKRFSNRNQRPISNGSIQSDSTTSSRGDDTQFGGGQGPKIGEDAWKVLWSGFFRVDRSVVNWAGGGGDGYGVNGGPPATPHIGASRSENGAEERAYPSPTSSSNRGIFQQHHMKTLFASSSATTSPSRNSHPPETPPVASTPDTTTSSIHFSPSLLSPVPQLPIVGTIEFEVDDQSPQGRWFGPWLKRVRSAKPKETDGERKLYLLGKSGSSEIPLNFSTYSSKHGAEEEEVDEEEEDEAAEDEHGARYTMMEDNDEADDEHQYHQDQLDAGDTSNAATYDQTQDDSLYNHDSSSFSATADPLGDVFPDDELEWANMRESRMMNEVDSSKFVSLEDQGWDKIKGVEALEEEDELDGRLNHIERDTKEILALLNKTPTYAPLTLKSPPSSRRSLSPPPRNSLPPPPLPTSASATTTTFSNAISNGNKPLMPPSTSFTLASPILLNEGKFEPAPPKGTSLPVSQPMSQESTLTGGVNMSRGSTLSVATSVAMDDRRGSGMIMHAQLDDLEKVLHALSPRDLKFSTQASNEASPNVGILSALNQPTTEERSRPFTPIPPPANSAIQNVASPPVPSPKFKTAEDRSMSDDSVGKSRIGGSFLNKTTSNSSSERPAPDVPTTPFSAMSFGDVMSSQQGQPQWPTVPFSGSPLLQQTFSSNGDPTTPQQVSRETMERMQYDQATTGIPGGIPDKESPVEDPSSFVKPRSRTSSISKSLNKLNMKWAKDAAQNSPPLPPLPPSASLEKSRSNFSSASFSGPSRPSGGEGEVMGLFATPIGRSFSDSGPSPTADEFGSSIKQNDPNRLFSLRTADGASATDIPAHLRSPSSTSLGNKPNSVNISVKEKKKMKMPSLFGKKSPKPISEISDPVFNRRTSDSESFVSSALPPSFSSPYRDNYHQSRQLQRSSSSNSDPPTSPNSQSSYKGSNSNRPSPHNMKRKPVPTVGTSPNIPHSDTFDSLAGRGDTLNIESIDMLPQRSTSLSSSGAQAAAPSE